MSPERIPAAIAAVDPALAQAVGNEYGRQINKLEMIASENFASDAVLAANGCVMTSKYAEGYPGRRYYGGCEFVDVAEELAIKRSKKLFGAEHVNVQPHSGSQANMASYFSVLEPGDTILGMNLSHGGHLTHGSKVNFSGRFFNIVAYGVRKDTETLDYDELRAQAREHKPKMIIAGGSAIPRVIDFAKFREVADEVGAILLTDMAHFAGLVAGRVYPNPVPLCDFVTSTTHKTLRGPRSGFAICREQYAKGLDKTVFPGFQGGPLMHVVAAKAVAFLEALQPDFREYAKQILLNAQALAEGLKEAGLRIVSGGTDTHLMLVDVGAKGFAGKATELALDEAGITVNKNMIPFDTRKPTEASGVRIGTPALTTRGMGVKEMKQIAKWIGRVLENIEDKSVLEKVRAEVSEMASGFPLHKPVRIVEKCD